jgi:hypothetical protein
LRKAMNSAPASGKKVMTERIGQLVSRALRVT